MKKLPPTFEETQQLHREGRLAEAKNAYLEILAANPNETSVLHMLAMLAAEEGDLEAAQLYLEKAITIKNDDPALFLHLANIYKAKKIYSLAEQMLFNTIELHPQFSAAYNNLGTVLYAQEKWQEAVDAYQAAIDIQPDYIDAYYNLGLALIKNGARGKALTVYEGLLSLSPDHPGAHFQLACLLMQERKYQKAIEHFLFIAEKYPFHFETQVNMASSYLKMGDLQSAKSHYLQALEILPSDEQVNFNLGVISMQLSLIKDAIKFYLQAVTINNNYFAAHNNLAIAYLLLSNKQGALIHFNEALRIDPSNESVRHTINILLQDKNISGSPPEYVRSLFDSYADHYDAHMLKLLKYQGHQSLLQTAEKVIGKPAGDKVVLDLGCGTGLCGELFKPYAKSMTGVDLSSNMLAVAKQKNIYDKLVESDVVAFLQQQSMKYDLIIAGDMLIYSGELEAFFLALSQALKPSGYFIFNSEMTDADDFVMTVSGRFAHNKNYLDRLIKENKLKINYYNEEILRTQNNQSVTGHMYVVEKIA